MRKRLNPHQRLLAKQAGVIRDARKQQSMAAGEEMAKLQQGAVRSGLRSNPTSKTFRAPHWTDVDNVGKRKRKNPPRFGVKK